VKSDLLQFCQQTFAVTFLAKFVVIDTAILLQHVSLKSAGQIVCGMIQQFSFRFCASLRCSSHASNLLERVASFNSQIISALTPGIVVLHPVEHLHRPRLAYS
jgi:hypothetical protein